MMVISITLFSFVACDKPGQPKKPGNPYKALFKQKGSATEANLPYQTLAQVNIDSISTPLFELYLKAKKQNDPAYTASRLKSTNELITIFLLSQKARQENLHTLKKVKEQLRFQETSLLANIYLANVRSKITITDSEIEIAYNKRYLRQDNHEYKTRHIVVKHSKEAKQLLLRLKNKEDFATLARKHSTGPSASFGGALEWFRPNAVSRKFSAAVRRLSKGEMSPVPLKTSHGWHIILLEDIRKVDPPSLKEIHTRLYEDLKEEKVAKHIKKLRSLSNISINSKQ